MTAKTVAENLHEISVTIEEVNRVLELGRLLLSSLMSEELEELQVLL